MSKSENEILVSSRIIVEHPELPSDYYRLRDFEYVQPLYDLADLLELDALSKGVEVPKYRTFSLWRAGYSLDGYGTTIDRWLDGILEDEDLDNIPTRRIRQYLESVRTQGTITELQRYQDERFRRCLRLRSVRGLGPNKIATALLSESFDEDWCRQMAIETGVDQHRIANLYCGVNLGPWQSAHIVPPLLRFLRSVEFGISRSVGWSIAGIADPFEPIIAEVIVSANLPFDLMVSAVARTLRREVCFSLIGQTAGRIQIRHQLGWSFSFEDLETDNLGETLTALAARLDPLSRSLATLQGDLHSHTAWSDGSASVEKMAKAVVNSGLQYFAVTDHSRSSKVQGGLTPPLWLRQANALALAHPVCPILHGIEVDILKGGDLDLPHNLLAAADFVVASVHSNWTKSASQNTDRLIRAVESGCVDTIGHPSSVVVGKPGVPDYYRPAAEVHWDEVFEKCAQWRVALELNCFPSRLDLSLPLLQRAVAAGCSISMGSDAHARSHLINLRFGEAALSRLKPNLILNRLSHRELCEYVEDSRSLRRAVAKPKHILHIEQPTLQFDEERKGRVTIRAQISLPQHLPAGSRVIGIDLTAGNKTTGVALLDNSDVTTCSLSTDAEILEFIRIYEPSIVSIDSPLGLPGGGLSIDPRAGIVRVAENDLSSIGIPAYPALIDSMQNLTLRGIRLKTQIEAMASRPLVIESYPGAAQDILSIPRKQKGLDLLREGLRRLGLAGAGLDTSSHDEMDAITSAIVGRYFEAGLYEPMGIPSEAQLIVPKVSPLHFEKAPIICLAGKTGAGKSVVARYLSVFYGFGWIRTRDIIQELLFEDLEKPLDRRLSNWNVNPSAIAEEDLQAFGTLVLSEYRQGPLRSKLANVIRNHSGPLVVDAIRDVADVDPGLIADRPIFIWSVDCTDNLIYSRLVQRRKLGNKKYVQRSPVDKTADFLSKQSHNLISNRGSFEELRWGIDDALFSAITITRVV